MVGVTGKMDRFEFYEVTDKLFKLIKTLTPKTNIQKTVWMPSALWDHGEEHKIDTNYLFVCDSAGCVQIYNVQFARTSGMISNISV